MGLELLETGSGAMRRAGTAASRAFRRLVERVLPAGDDRDHDTTSTGRVASSSSSSPAPVTKAPNGPAEAPQQPSEARIAINSTAEAPASNAASAPAETMASPRRSPRKPTQHDDKENRPPTPSSVAGSIGLLSLDDKLADHVKPGTPPTLVIEDPAMAAERAMHLGFIDEALEMARLALKTNETPVGCVLVHDNKIIARGMNATNVTRNGTRHAEFMALSALLSYAPANGARATCLKPKPREPVSDESSDAATPCSQSPDEGNEDGSKGHLYPYGQKLHPSPRVDRNIIQDSTLYVTVEPCVMCASLLRQLGIKKVYFGAVNDKFGGTGGVFSIHANSLPVSNDGQTASAHPMPKPTTLPDGSGTLGVSFPPGGGDGGNIESGYEIEGGWGRDEAVALLRRFYVQENGRAPMPRKKEGRAARLAAMMEKDGDASATSAIVGPNSDADAELGITNALVEVN